MKLLRDPLIQFLGAGLLLFILVSALEPAPTQIEVGEKELALYLQYRNKAFSPAAAKAHLAALSKEERRLLMIEYGREEALYREALILGLDRNDQIIRQRLVQKMEFVAAAMIAAKPIDANAHYEANLESYRAPVRLSFTHLFFREREDALAAHPKIKQGEDVKG